MSLPCGQAHANLNRIKICRVGVPRNIINWISHINENHKSVAGTAGTKIVSVCAGGGDTEVTGHYHLYLSRLNVVELVLASVEEVFNDDSKVLNI